MMVITMLDLDSVDLRSIGEALEDHTIEHRWYLDPATGEVQFQSDHVDDDAEGPDELGWIPIDAIAGGESYRELEDFTARVHDPRARGLLERAIAGRGAFQRFKETLLEFPDLRQAWFAFHDARMSRRAVEWLLDEGLVDAAAAERKLAELSDPDLPELSGGVDAEAVAADVAAQLRGLYGDRLREVLLFGSWARGEADEESDLDLLIVLDKVDSAFAEIRRMDEVLWEQSLAHNVVVSAVPVEAGEFGAAATAFLQRVRAEGLAVP